MTKLQLKKIGFFLKTHGIYGDLVLALEENFDIDLIDEIIQEGNPVFVDRDGIPVPFFIAPDGLRDFGQNSYLLRFENVADTKSKEMVSSVVYIESSRFQGIKNEVSVAFDDFIGYHIRDINTPFFGEIIDYAGLKENPLFLVNSGNKEILIPAVSDFIVSVDDNKREIIINLPVGFLEAMF
jgi:16S rRNA processing protein RimM